MNIKEIQRVVGQIKANLFKKSNSISVGTLKSQFRGSGLQFREHRVYTHGDDVRFIDWKMLAKTRRPYIRTFEEDRNVEICVIIDASPSMYLGHEGVSKFQASIEICCLLYLLAKESGDTVHALIVGEKVINVPKASGEKGIATLVTTLERHGLLSDEGEVNYPENLDYNPNRDDRFKAIMAHLGKRREVVILSDFNEFFEEAYLKRLFARRNVHPFRVLAPIDFYDKLPFGVFAKVTGLLKASFVKASAKGGDLEKVLSGKVSELRVDKRYLEQFVKKMV